MSVSHPSQILKCLNYIEHMVKRLELIINNIVYFYKNNKIHYINAIVEGYFTIRCFTYYGSERTPTLTMRHHDVIAPKSYRRDYFR